MSVHEIVRSVIGGRGISTSASLTVCLASQRIGNLGFGLT